MKFHWGTTQNEIVSSQAVLVTRYKPRTNTGGARIGRLIATNSYACSKSGVYFHLYFLKDNLALYCMIL